MVGLAREEAMARIPTPIPRTAAFVFSLAIALSTARPPTPGTWTSRWPAVAGAVTALAMSPADPATLTAGAAGGIYRTTDAGDTWTLQSPALRLLAALAID